MLLAALDYFYAGLSQRVDEMKGEAGGPERPGDRPGARHVASHLSGAVAMLKVINGWLDSIRTLYEVVGLSGNSGDLDKSFKSFVTLRDRYNAEVVSPLQAFTDQWTGGGATIEDEKRAISEAEGSVQGILHQLELEIEFIRQRQRVLSGSDKPVNKSVVSVDRAQYSRHARLLESYKDATLVEALNEQIASLIHSSIADAEVKKEETLSVLLGDGAIVLFDTAEQGVKFIRKLHEKVGDHNSRDRDPSTDIHFRYGIATGRIALRTALDEGKVVSFTMAGVTVIQAVRLQAAAGNGELVVCPETFARLPEEERKKRGWKQARLKGKRHEGSFDGFAFQLPGSPTVSSAGLTRQRKRPTKRRKSPGVAQNKKPRRKPSNRRR